MGKCKPLKIIVFAFLAGAVLPLSASGARFPDAVEKTIVITGEAAVSLAELFGLSTSGPNSLSLRLGRGNAWAVYLLKLDTPERLWNANEGCPARYNTVEFSPSPVNSVTISPYWLNLATRHPEPKPAYAFESPFLTGMGEPDDPWTGLLLRLKTETGWNGESERPFQRSFRSAEGVEIRLRVFRARDYPENAERIGYRIVIEADILPTN